MANPLEITPHASGVETASSSGQAVDIGELRSCVALRLSLSSISGTGATIRVLVETAPAQTGPWSPVGEFTPLSVAKAIDQTFADTQRWVRVRWVLSGTGPSADFSVSGKAHVLYAKLSDIESLGIPQGATLGMKASDRAKHALAATDEAEGYLAGGYTLPLASWDAGLTEKVTKLAIYIEMCSRGFQPEGEDALIVKNRDDAISWFGKLAKGIVRPPSIVDSSPAVSGSRARIRAGVSGGNSPRGW